MNALTVAHGNVYTILHIFTPTDVGVFLLKMCKICTFFYFKRLYVDCCGCFYCSNCT